MLDRSPISSSRPWSLESRLKRLLLDNRLPAGDNNSDWNENVFHADNFDVIRDAFDKVFNEARAHEYTRVYEECVAERDLARDRREQACLAQLSDEERAREAVRLAWTSPQSHTLAERQRPRKHSTSSKRQVASRTSAAMSTSCVAISQPRPQQPPRFKHRSRRSVKAFTRTCVA